MFDTILINCYFLLEAEASWCIYGTFEIILCSYRCKLSEKQAIVASLALYTYQPTSSASHSPSCGPISLFCITAGQETQNAQTQCKMLWASIAGKIHLLFPLAVQRWWSLYSICHVLTVDKQLYLCAKSLAQKCKSSNFEAMVMMAMCNWLFSTRFFVLNFIERRQS